MSEGQVPYQRKRAAVEVPLTIISRALGLPIGVHLEFISQNAEQVAKGTCEMLIGGDELDPCFLTVGPAAPGRLHFDDGDDRPEAAIVPVDQKSPTG